MCSEKQDVLLCAGVEQDEAPVESAFTFLIKLLDEHEAEREKKRLNQVP